MIRTAIKINGHWIDKANNNTPVIKKTLTANFPYAEYSSILEVKEIQLNRTKVFRKYRISGGE